MKFPRTPFLIVLLGMLAILPEADALNLQIPTRPTQFPLEIDTNQVGGSVVGWSPSDFLPSLPSNLTNVVQVDGRLFGLALNSNGTIVAWGNNTRATNLPIGLSNVVQVSAGLDEGLALKSDGTVVAWGANSFGNSNIPVGLTNVVQVSEGDIFGLALKSDGTVASWGLGITNMPIGLSNIVQVSAGCGLGLALKSDGRVVAWDVYYNQSAYAYLTSVPTGLSNVVQVYAGDDFALALKDDGTVVAWGGNLYGATNVPVGLSNVVQVSANDIRPVALKNDGTIVTWGNYASYYNQFQPLTNALQVSCGLALCVTGAPAFLQIIWPYDPIPNQVVGVPFTLFPTALSGLPVTLSIKSGPATVSSNTITPTGVGTVVVAANQSGNANYNPAPEVTASFTVKNFNQGIANFKTIPPKIYPCPPFAVTLPKATSGLPVTLSVISGPATVKGNTVTVTTAGVVVLGANQGGNSKYNSAPQVTTSFSVGTKTTTQKITPFKKIPNKTHGTSFTITLPTASSGLPVAVTVQSGNATINGNTLTLTGTGYVTLAADQGGNQYFNPAPEVTTTFFVQ